MPKRTNPADRTDRQIPLPVRKNLLLGSLQPNDRHALERQLEPIVFRLGDVLHRPGEPIEGVYFPESVPVVPTQSRAPDSPVRSHRLTDD